MSAQKAQALVTMDDLLNESPPKMLEVGQVIEAHVISVDKGDIWLDLGPLGSGLVAKREFNAETDLTPGTEVSASVIDPESVYGFPVLSLKKVAREKGWEYLQKVQESGETITVYPYDANRGGLLIEVEGIRGFLPVSQLTAQHYPRVSNADKDEILQRLHSLIKQPLQVRVLDVDREQNKLIVSEKEALKELTQKRLAKLKVGEIVEGTVTGTVDFGVFVTVDDIEGLIHISEISWDRVTNPSDYVKVGQTVKAKIIAMDDDKLSLSMKQLQEDPWLKEIGSFKSGDIVEGTITRVTPFGAFIQLTPAIEALVHVSELGEGEKRIDPKEFFSVGEKRSFTILDIDKEARKISLTLKEKKPKTKS
jgi:small subunit ribosomal protein S1